MGLTGRQLTGLWLLNPPHAIARVAARLQAHGGDVTRAAESLDIGKRTLNRWIHDTPELQRRLEEIRMESGNASARPRQKKR